MKTIEIINGQARKITPLTPLRRGIEGILTKQQIGRGESILTRADKERIKADAKHLDQISKEHLTARLASDPKIPTHIEMFGKTYTFYEGFVAYTELRMRLEREAAARGETHIDESQLPWRPHPLPEQQEQPLTPEQRMQRDIPIVRKLHAQLAQEVEDAQFDQIAKYIKTRQWRDNNVLAPVSTIRQSGQVDVTIQDDGTVINRSRFGVTISYAQDARTGEPVGKKKPDGTRILENGISIGIGYFGNREEIIPEARESVSNAALEQGVKALFIQRRQLGKTEQYVIPLAYAKNQEEFIEYLYEVAQILSPEQMRWQRRIQRTQQAAA